MHFSYLGRMKEGEEWVLKLKGYSFVNFTLQGKSECTLILALINLKLPMIHTAPTHFYENVKINLGFCMFQLEG